MNAREKFLAFQDAKFVIMQAAREALRTPHLIEQEHRNLTRYINCITRSLDDAVDAMENEDPQEDETPVMNVIERLLARQQEQCCRLSQVKRDDQDRYDLEDLWDTLTTPVHVVLAEYPVYDEELKRETYEQQESGMECRRVIEHNCWLCADEQDGFYLVSDDESQEWAMEEKEN